MINVEAILKIFEKNNPAPKCELNYTTDFNFLIAIILSAQSTDKRVNIVTKELFNHINTPYDIEKIGIDALETLIKTIGLFRSKAKNIFNLAKELIAKYNGQIPFDFDTLLQLPGIGRKTASVFLNTLLNENYIAVDTHVQRLSERLNFSKAKTPLKIENDLRKIIPAKYQSRISNWLVLHGRYTCSAKKPKCPNCEINRYCDFYQMSKCQNVKKKT